MEHDKEETKVTINGIPENNKVFVYIGTAYNVNPNATKVENKYFINGASKEQVESQKTNTLAEKPQNPSLRHGGKNMSYREMLKLGMINTTAIKTEIINYVSKVRKYTKEETDSLYIKLWNEIVNNETFSIDIFDNGRQRCKFNRNLVASIIYYLYKKDFFDDNTFSTKSYNASELARVLEDDVSSPVRQALTDSLSKKYKETIDSLIEKLSK